MPLWDIVNGIHTLSTDNFLCKTVAVRALHPYIIFNNIPKWSLHSPCHHHHLVLFLIVSTIISTHFVGDVSVKNRKVLQGWFKRNMYIMNLVCKGRMWGHFMNIYEFWNWSPTTVKRNGNPNVSERLGRCSRSGWPGIYPSTFLPVGFGACSDYRLVCSDSPTPVWWCRAFIIWNGSDPIIMMHLCC